MTNINIPNGHIFSTDDRFKEGLSSQQILDLSTYHLGTMTERCSAPVDGDEGPTTQCVYRDGKGNSCALGYFISDEEYSPEMEQKVACQLLDQHLLPMRLVDKSELLGELQTIHDQLVYWSGNRQPMRQRLYQLYGEQYCNPAMLDHPDMAWNN